MPKCTHCVCLLNESQGLRHVFMCTLGMISLNLNWSLLQGDMGPLGEMGLPGPNGLKVISHMDCIVLFALRLNYIMCYIIQENGQF